jgi:hypothetical protein
MAIENPKKHMDLGFIFYFLISIIFGYLFKSWIENMLILNIKNLVKLWLLDIPKSTWFEGKKFKNIILL